MYIEKIKINKFRVLEDIEVRFQGPDLSAVEEGRGNGNVVNVIAGVNGTGKTSLLSYIGVHYQSLGESVSEADSFFQRATEGQVIFIKASVKYDEILEFIKNYVIERERKVFDADPKTRLLSAISEFNQFYSDLGIHTKLADLGGAETGNKPFFTNAAGQEVSIHELSAGELSVYSLSVQLMKINPSDSVVLVDEPELHLHPSWQEKIMQIYSRIGQNNQFIVATHSPQVIASVPYQNRIVLYKEDGKIKPVYCHQPPSGVDVNSILAEVMGADPRPKEVIERYQRYRQLVEQKQENSEEAQKLRGLLVNDEGEHSRFMQEMAFFVELRDAA